MKLIMAITTSSLLCAAGFAQETRVERREFQYRTFVQTGEGKIVKGAPYSAEAVTETTQTLSDGNRITRKNTSSIVRDSDGRTRVEENLSFVGPWATAAKDSRLILITDPVARVRYTIDDKNRTVIETPAASDREQILRRTLERAAASGKEEARTRVEISGNIEPGGLNRVIVIAGNNPGRKNTRTELLGTQTIEGVVAEGKRVTETIPAGEIGNDRPIEVVSETWYSNDLQTVVLSRHTDPRIGETVYKLTNINRAEPPHSAFEVPAGYTVKEGGNADQKVKMIERAHQKDE